MSESVIITTGTNFKREKPSFPVKISPDIAQEIDSIAVQRQMRVELLVNEILSQYLLTQSNDTKQNGAAFLLSIAGIFNSETNDTSENVRAIVKDFILQKQS